MHFFSLHFLLLCLLLRRVPFFCRLKQKKKYLLLWLNSFSSLFLLYFCAEFKIQCIHLCWRKIMEKKIIINSMRRWAMQSKRIKNKWTHDWMQKCRQSVGRQRVNPFFYIFHGYELWSNGLFCLLVEYLANERRTQKKARERMNKLNWYLQAVCTSDTILCL